MNPRFLLFERVEFPGKPIGRFGQEVESRLKVLTLSPPTCRLRHRGRAVCDELAIQRGREGHFCLSFHGSSDPALIRYTATMPADPIRAEVRRAGEIRVGDIVSRDGTDRQKVLKVWNDGETIEVECVVAPDSGWCAVGELENNLGRRYHVVNRAGNFTTDLNATPRA